MFPVLYVGLSDTYECANSRVLCLGYNGETLWCDSGAVKFSVICIVTYVWMLRVCYMDWGVSELHILGFDVVLKQV